MERASLVPPVGAGFGGGPDEGGFGGDVVRDNLPLTSLVEVGVESFGKGVVREVADALERDRLDRGKIERGVAELSDVGEAWGRADVVQIDPLGG